MSDVVVVGAGLAGLMAAARLTDNGHRVTLVSFGVGGLQLSHGCLDVLGYAPDRVGDPLAALPEFCAAHPEHPYAVLGTEAVRSGMDYAGAFFGGVVVSRPGNWLLPTALGGVRPTYYAHRTMTAAHDVLASGGGRVVVAGMAQLKDFQPALVAGNLERMTGVSAIPVVVDVEARPREVDSSALSYARALDDPAALERFAKAVGSQAAKADLVLLPAVLGLKDRGVPERLSELLDAPVAEVPLVPPSVPGMRLNEFVNEELKLRRVRVVLGARATALESAGGRITAVTAHTTGHDSRIACDAVVYAPGGFESGALAMDSYGRVSEGWLGLPVRVPRGGLVTHDRKAVQPLFESGLGVDASMRVLGDDGAPLHPNLFAAGGIIAGAQRWRELSGDGIAVASAVRAADRVEELA